MLGSLSLSVGDGREPCLRRNGATHAQPLAYRFTQVSFIAPTGARREQHAFDCRQQHARPRTSTAERSCTWQTWAEGAGGPGCVLPPWRHYCWQAPLDLAAVMRCQELPAAWHSAAA